MQKRNTAYANAVEQLLMKVSEDIFGGDPPDEKVVLVVAGGAAVHQYTGARVSKDLDAVFLAKVLKPDAVVVYKDETGEQRSVHLDRAYSTTLDLMHEDYLERTAPSGWAAPGFEVRILHPVDLAISKLGRWAEHDRSDVKSLIDKGLLNRDSFERMANEALSYFVGNTKPVRMNIADALKLFPDPRAGSRREP